MSDYIQGALFFWSIFVCRIDSPRLWSSFRHAWRAFSSTPGGLFLRASWTSGQSGPAAAQVHCFTSAGDTRQTSDAYVHVDSHDPLDVVDIERHPLRSGSSGNVERPYHPRQGNPDGVGGEVPSRTGTTAKPEGPVPIHERWVFRHIVRITLVEPTWIEGVAMREDAVVVVMHVPDGRLQIRP
jgi:hypothetical protein